MGAASSRSWVVKLVKQQVNGNDRIVLKTDATLEDLRLEAARLQEKFGYEVKPDGKAGSYVATHRFFSGKFVLALEPQ